ncbi:MAG: zinc-ribbon domain-containing protein [Oscillospiraceae bacterium]|nr:zinc-ribbon domain-containing protein [Candidatus Ruminococcus equi]
MYCRKCGQEIPDDSVFCQYCSEQLVTEQPKKTVNYYPERDNPTLATQTPQVEPVSNVSNPISEEQATKLVKSIKRKNFFKGLFKAILFIILIVALAIIIILGYQNCTGQSEFSLDSIISIFVNPINSKNYDKIEKGMTYDEVVKIFGGQKGVDFIEVSVDDNKSTIYVWYGKSKYEYCTVEFINNKVYEKSQIGLK